MLAMNDSEKDEVCRASRLFRVEQGVDPRFASAACLGFTKNVFVGKTFGFPSEHPLLFSCGVRWCHHLEVIQFLLLTNTSVLEQQFSIGGVFKITYLLVFSKSCLSCLPQVCCAKSVPFWLTHVFLHLFGWQKNPPHHHWLQVAGAHDVRKNGSLRAKVSRTVARHNMPTDLWRRVGLNNFSVHGNKQLLFFLESV